MDSIFHNLIRFFRKEQQLRPQQRMEVLVDLEADLEEEELLIWPQTPMEMEELKATKFKQWGKEFQSLQSLTILITAQVTPLRTEEPKSLKTPTKTTRWTRSATSILKLICRALFRLSGTAIALLILIQDQMGREQYQGKAEEAPAETADQGR